MGQAYDMQSSRPKQSVERERLGSRTQNTTSGSSRSGKRAHRRFDRERDDSSNWVHREKLIALEIQDHIDRGERVPQALLDAQADSNDTSSTAPDRGGHESSESYPERYTFTSPEPPQEDYDVEQEDEDEEFIPEDPRTPEEIAEEAREMDQAQSMYHSPGLRSSSSRIPISKASPHPVPQEHLERNALLPRKRSASIGLDGDGPTMYPRTRSRSGSNSSQVLFDDTEPMPGMPPSPSKARQVSKTTPRKASGNTTPGSVSKARAASNGQGTSPSAHLSTNDGRPRTANRPEEPAPWLADMYKPDPHLPQDQQIIPTHAKRLMQEQQQREDPGRDQRERQKMQQAAAKTRSEQNHPLPQPPNDYHEEQTVEEISEKAPARESPPAAIPHGERYEPMKSPGSEHGGYRTMPKVNSPTTASQATRMPQPIYFQEAAEEAPQKKGCACCVVM
jgi:hypothetical protein